jgi:alkylation response protein AidB-like acyl-CoA dehydrogenase
LIVGLGWCGPAVMLHADEAQRVRFLPPLLQGDEVWCQLFSEPGAGSDSAGMRTAAVRDGDEWVINGQKVWTTFAHRSDWGLCVARHDPDLPKHRGLTAFMVDMRHPGVYARPLRQMTDSANFNEVFLDDVRVPDDCRIGGVGDGWRVVVATYMWERLSAVSDGEHILDGLAALIAETGRASEPAIRDRYARIYASAAALKYTGLRLMTAISRGSMPGPEGSIMKLGATMAATDLFDLAIEVQGAAGMLARTEAPWAGEWQAAFLGGPGLRIGGGTDEVQRNVIGERVLGLPGDVRVDKDVPFREIPAG